MRAKLSWAALQPNRRKRVNFNFNWGKPRAIKTMNRHKTATDSYLVYWKAHIWPSSLKTTKSSQKSIKTFILTKQIKKLIEQNRSTSTYMMSRVHRQPKLLAKSIQQLKTLKFQLLWPCIKSKTKYKMPAYFININNKPFAYNNLQANIFQRPIT